MRAGPCRSSSSDPGADVDGVEPAWRTRSASPSLYVTGWAPNGVSLTGLTRTLTQLRATVRATGPPGATGAPEASDASEQATR